MCVGKRIRDRRKSLDISADDLAKYVGVSRATIFRYERGDIEKMPAVTLDLIAKKLRTSPSILMGWETEDSSKPNSSIETIAAHIDDDVTEEEMEDIMNYIEFIKSKKK